MCLFRRIREGRIPDAINDNRAQIDANVKQIDKLMALLESDETTFALLGDLRKVCAFLSPKKDRDAIGIDKKISSQLGDIELMARKSEKSGDYTDIQDQIKTIRILISKR